MTTRQGRPKPPGDAADIIAQGMNEVGLTEYRLAEMLETGSGVVSAILEREVPIPLMWVPNIADAIDCDAKVLMTAALSEQWLATLTAIAGSLLWEEGAVQRELTAFLTEANGGECPSVSEDPALARRLVRALRHDDEDGDNGTGDPSVH